MLSEAAIENTIRPMCKGVAGPTGDYHELMEMGRSVKLWQVVLVGEIAPVLCLVYCTVLQWRFPCQDGMSMFIEKAFHELQFASVGL